MRTNSRILQNGVNRYCPKCDKGPLEPELNINKNVRIGKLN